MPDKVKKNLMLFVKAGQEESEQAISLLQEFVEENEDYKLSIFADAVDEIQLPFLSSPAGNFYGLYDIRVGYVTYKNREAIFRKIEAAETEIKRILSDLKLSLEKIIMKYDKIEVESIKQ